MLNSITIEIKGTGWSPDRYTIEKDWYPKLFEGIQNYKKNRATALLRGTIQEKKIQEKLVSLHTGITTSIYAIITEDEYCYDNIKKSVNAINLRSLVAFCISNPYKDEDIVFQIVDTNLKYKIMHPSPEIENNWTQIYISSYYESHYNHKDRRGSEYFINEDFIASIEALCLEWQNMPLIWGSTHEGEFSIYLNPIYKEPQVLSFMDSINQLLPEAQQLPRRKILEFIKK